MYLYIILLIFLNFNYIIFHCISSFLTTKVPQIYNYLFLVNVNEKSLINTNNHKRKAYDRSSDESLICKC